MRRPVFHTGKPIGTFAPSTTASASPWAGYQLTSTAASVGPYRLLAALISLGLGTRALPLAAPAADGATAAAASTPATTDGAPASMDAKTEAAGDTIVVTAAKQNLQAPGVSTITADEIRKRPPARDVSELIRTMPGVNLTGNSTSGQRGNNRQIDIRGMGPENTLILIDGLPVSSRNSVRQG